MSTISSPAIERGKSSQVCPLTIPPRGSMTVRATGRVFHVIDSTCRVEIKMDSTSACLYGAGCGLTISGPGIFEWLEVFNPSNEEIFVLLYVGFADYRDVRHYVTEAPTEARAVAMTQLAAASGKTLSGQPAGRATQRKQVVASNMDPAALVYLRDSAGSVIAPVFPQTSITLPIAGPVELWNPNGAAVACYLSEVWYVVPAS